MRKVWRFFLLAVTGLALMVFSPPVIGQAKEIPATGLDANSAVIKNSKGKIFAHDVQLPPGNYTVSYNWGISNTAKISAGDTMTFTLPTNFPIPEEENFNSYTASGALIGTIHVDQGGTIGVMTFNSYFQTHTLNRRGWIKINVDVPAKPTEPISMAKSASWVDPEHPSVINWQLVVHSAGNTLTNPVIKDTFSRNQTYVAGSVKASDDSGQSIPVTVTSSQFSNATSFRLSGSYTSNITLTYQTKTVLPTGGDTFNNTAVYRDDGGHQATADAVIDREDLTEPETPDNPGPETPGQKEPITMAKSVSWVDPNDQTKLNWSIDVNDHGNELVNPQIIDKLSAGQTFVTGSAKMVTSSGDRVMLAMSISGNGRVLVFKGEGTYTTGLHLTYQTAVTPTRGTAVFTNDAAFSDDNNNNANADAEIDRTVEPEVPTSEPITMKKSAAWADPDKKTTINWELAVSANDNKLVNPTITDKLSANHSFVAGSAKAVTATGTVIPVKAEANGTELIFHLSGTYNTNFKLTYQTTTDEKNTTATFTNVALYTDEADNQASADAAIDREAVELPPITMKKTAAWSDPTDKTKINWLLTVSANGHDLMYPVVTDQLSDNQTYVLDSVKAQDEDGDLPVTATVNGAQVIFSIFDITTGDLQVTYQTTTKDATGAAVFDNAAVIDDDDGNHAEGNTSIDREGPPVEPAKDPITLTKTATWTDPNDPQKINWQLKVVTNGNTLLNPVVTDILSDNQTYLADSANAADATGNTIPVTVTVNDNTVTFKFSGALTSDLTLTYQSTTNSATGAATFDNAAIVDDDNNNHAGGGSSIDREEPPEEAEKDPISMTKVAAWSDPNDHSRITWTLAIKANENQLLNPVITDLLSNNQTYLPDSAQAVDSNGSVLPLTVSVSGHTITFKLAGDFDTNITLTYQTKTNQATGAAVFDNAALYTDDNDNNASASSEIERPEVIPEVPGDSGETTEPNPSTPDVDKPETNTPGNTSKPTPEIPATSQPAPSKPAPAKPAVVPSQPATPARRGQKPLPTSYQPTSGRLPQTDEHRNATVDTIVGLFVLFLSLGIGYLDLRHCTL